MPHLRLLVKISMHLSILIMALGLFFFCPLFVSRLLTWIIAATVLGISEWMIGRSPSSSPLHFSIAVLLFFAIFYITVFSEKPLGFALLTSAGWLIGRLGFLLGCLSIRNQTTEPKTLSINSAK